MERKRSKPGSQDRLDATFGALASPTRRAILVRLACGQASVNELAEPFDVSTAAISKHLQVLQRAGLISRRRDAQRLLSRLEAAPLGDAVQWLQKHQSFSGGTAFACTPDEGVDLDTPRSPLQARSAVANPARSKPA